MLSASRGHVLVRSDADFVQQAGQKQRQLCSYRVPLQCLATKLTKILEMLLTLNVTNRILHSFDVRNSDVHPTTGHGPMDQRPITMKTAVKSAKRGRPTKTAAKRRQYMHDSHNGVVSALEAYSIRELIDRFGFGRKWLTKARKGGLKLVPLGRQKGVRGAELLRYLETQEA